MPVIFNQLNPIIRVTKDQLHPIQRIFQQKEEIKAFIGFVPEAGLRYHATVLGDGKLGEF